MLVWPSLPLPQGNPSSVIGQTAINDVYCLSLRNETGPLHVTGYTTLLSFFQCDSRFENNWNTKIPGNNKIRGQCRPSKYQNSVIFPDVFLKLCIHTHQCSFIYIPVVYQKFFYWILWKYFAGNFPTFFKQNFSILKTTEMKFF